MQRGLWLALFAVIIGAGCGKNDAASDAVGELRQLKSEMCRCKDRSCAEAVVAKTRTLSDRYKASAPTPAQMKAIAPLFEDLSACRSKVTGMSAEEMETADLASDQVGRLSRIKDEMCACKGPLCAHRVDEKLEALERMAGDTPMSAGSKWAAAPVVEELGRCRFKVTGESKPQGPVDAALAKMKAFRDEMCACNDKACADNVRAEMQNWGDSLKGDEPKGSPDEVKEAGKVMEEMLKCMRKVAYPTIP